MPSISDMFSHLGFAATGFPLYLLQHPILVTAVAIAVIYFVVVCPIVRDRRIRKIVADLRKELPDLRAYDIPARLGRVIRKIENADAVIRLGRKKIHLHAPSEVGPASSSWTADQRLQHLQQALAADAKSIPIAGCEAAVLEFLKAADIDFKQLWDEAGRFLHEHPEELIKSLKEVIKLIVSAGGEGIDAENLLSVLVSSFDHALTAGSDTGNTLLHLPANDAAVPYFQHDDISIDASAITDSAGLETLDADWGAEAVGTPDVTDAAPDFIPIFTLAISSAREAKLLSAGKTTLGHSLKHITLDATGTAVGGALGAAAGSVVLPFFGTILGAFLGGLIGRGFTNRIKLQPFYEAKEAYERAVEEHNSECARSVQDWYDAYASSSTAMHAAYDEQCSEFPLVRESAALENSVNKLTETLLAEYEMVEEKIGTRCAQYVATFCDGHFGLFLMSVKGRLAKALGSLTAAERLRAESFASSIASVSDTISQLHLCKQAECLRQGTFRSALSVFEKQVDELIACEVLKFRQWVQAAIVSQAAATGELAKLCKEHRVKHGALLEKWESRLKPLERDLREIGGRLGFSF